MLIYVRFHINFLNWRLDAFSSQLGLPTSRLTLLLRNVTLAIPSTAFVCSFVYVQNNWKSRRRISTKLSWSTDAVPTWKRKDFWAPLSRPFLAEIFDSPVWLIIVTRWYDIPSGMQWRRTVVKCRGQSGSVRSSHQTVSDYSLRQWFPNTQNPGRRLENLVLPSIIDEVFHHWWWETCTAQLSNNSSE